MKEADVSALSFVLSQLIRKVDNYTSVSHFAHILFRFQLQGIYCEQFEFISFVLVILIKPSDYLKKHEHNAYVDMEYIFCMIIYFVSSPTFQGREKIEGEEINWPDEISETPSLAKASSAG